MPRYRFQAASIDEMSGMNPSVPVTQPDAGPSMVVGFGEAAPAQLDLFLRKKYRVFQAGLVMVIGEIGYGKSYFIKMLLTLMLTLQRKDGKPFRISADDLKLYTSATDDDDIMDGTDRKPATNIAGGEYGPFARLTESKVVTIRNGQFDILDHRLGLTTAQKHRLLSMVVMQLNGDDSGLPPYWDTAIMTALKALETRPIKEQTYRNFIEYVNKDPQERDQNDVRIYWPKLHGKEQRISPEWAYEEATSQLSDVLTRLEGGIYGNTYNGDKSLYDALTQRAVVFDYTTLDDPEIAMFQMILNEITAASMLNGNRDLEVHIKVNDEASRIMRIPGVAKSQAHAIKVIRSLGHLYIMSTQGIRDIMATDSPFAINSIGDFAMVVCFRLKHEEAKNIQIRFNLDDKVRERLETLGQGECIILIEGHSPQYIRVPRTDLLDSIGYTDQASDANLPQFELESAGVRL